MSDIQKFMLVLMIGLSACDFTENSSRTLGLLLSQESLEGTNEYLQSPFVTAGDRVYIVGHQDGSFPDLGWHVTGEMGGVWDHPIKLMDGYSMHLTGENLDWCLDNATTFTNFPIGNQHSFERGDLLINRYQFVPDQTEGVVILFEIENGSETTMSLDLLFTGMIDLQPVWLWDSLHIEDGEDEVEWDQNHSTIIANDKNNPWFTVMGTDLDSPEYEESVRCPTDRRGNGVDAGIKGTLTLEPGETRVVHYFIAGSYSSREAALSTFNRLKMHHTSLLETKLERYSGLAGTTALSTGDPGFDRMFRWTKFNTDWLVRDVPEQGRALSAGIPDYPWWFGTDNGYTIQGLLAAGMHEEALATIDLIVSLSRERNGNGRIVHEVSTNGVVFNPGNLNTTPYFIYALWRAYEWTGNDKILEEYYDDVIRGIDWIQSQDKDGNGYPDGAGMMEIHGMHSEMIDVVAYLAKAYQAAANFALVAGDVDRVEEYEAKAAMLGDKINEEWWVEEFGSFADFRSTRDEALELIDAAIVRADTIDKPWSVEELADTRSKVARAPVDDLAGFVVHHNWVVNTPLEMGLADSAKALTALETAKKYRNRFGMFVTGIDRDEQQEKAEQWKSFSYVGAVMTLPTGVQAIAAARYGQPDQSLEYLKRLENSFGYAFPGSMYEVSPDFGMIVQAWNMYAVAVPVVHHLFGLYPSAFQEKVFFTPQMPSAWEKASLSNVSVGDNKLTIDFSSTPDEFIYIVQQTKADWSIIFSTTGDRKISINGEPVYDPNTEVIISGVKNTIVVSR